MYNPQLDTFMIAAETGSFSKASRQLFVTSSAVLQQVNNLEECLGVKLFIRTNQGLKLTAAGEFLYNEIPHMKEWCHGVRERMLYLSKFNENVIHLALPKMHKSRFFYELWTTYSALHPEQTLQYVELNTTSSTDFVNQANFDLVEYPDFSFPWQQSHEFLYFTDCPIGIGVPSMHPLHSKHILIPEDIAGMHIVVHNDQFAHLLESYIHVLENAGAICEYVSSYTMTLLSECVIENKLILIPACSHNAHAYITYKPFDWDAKVPYGIFYSTTSTPSTLSFIEYTRQQLSSGTLIPSW